MTDRIRVMELVRSFQVGEIDRRAFKKASVAIGSVAAANALLVACRHEADVDEVPDPVVSEGENSFEISDRDSGINILAQMLKRSNGFSEFCSF